MARSPRVERSTADIKHELSEQLQLLRRSCQAYDSGFEAIGKHIALSLRVLLHQHGRSRSLLDQLGLRTGNFISSADPLDPRNLLPQHPLVLLHMADHGVRYLPLVTAGGGPTPMRRIPFVAWWCEPVLKDSSGHKFSRMELVSHVADTDGGAHVDPDLGEAYMALSRQNSLGWVLADGKTPLQGRPELARTRQIARELLLTLHELKKVEGSEPVIPTTALSERVVALGMSFTQVIDR